jgi:hypothetical protein
VSLKNLELAQSRRQVACLMGLRACGLAAVCGAVHMPTAPFLESHGVAIVGLGLGLGWGARTQGYMVWPRSWGPSHHDH